MDDRLKNYYNEHALQARQHENQRERITSIILSIVGGLLAFTSTTHLSSSSLIASCSIMLLGMFGFLFVGKHYERFRMHTSIMNSIRNEIDRLHTYPQTSQQSLQNLRQQGEINHYSNFIWPKFSGTESELQAKARSWIARQRMHVFWEMTHLLVVLIGLILTIVILLNILYPSPPH